MFDTVRGHRIEAEHDALYRLKRKTVSGGGLGGNVVEVLEYGENVADAQAKNLRGQLYRHYDQSGMATVPIYSFEGQPLQSQPPSTPKTGQS